MASDERLKELEEPLARKDAIMEPQVLQMVHKYIQAGGKPESLVGLLSDNYEGYAQMASLVCGWLQLADSVADLDAGTSTSSTAGPGPGSGGSSSTPDEFSFLQELAKERYDVDKFLGVFRRGPPAWLDGLTSDKRGRHLIYDLATAHQNCLLLNFAIQKLLKQGHEDEVASRGSSLAYYFGVYHRLLKRLMEQAAEAANEAALSSVIRELRAACAQSQHTYAHAQHLLTALSRQPGGEVMRRLSQEVEAAAVEAHGGAKVWALQPLLVPQDAPQSQHDATVLVSNVLVACDSGKGGLARTEGALQALVRLYQQQQTPLEPLKHPVFLELLLSGVFSMHAHYMSKEGTACCFTLLAMAAVAREEWREPHEQQQRQQQHHQGAEADGNGASQPTFLHLDCSDVPQVEEVLQSAVALARRAATGAKFGDADNNLAKEVCRTPMAVLGLLHYMRSVLGSAAHYADENKANASTPAFLELLRTCAIVQPGLMTEVASVISTVLTAMGSSLSSNSRGEVAAKELLNLLVQLMVAGATEQVLALVHEWSQTADPSLVRHFIWQVLGCVEPPYSSKFSRALLAPMLACNISIVRGSDAQQKLALLREFAQHAARLHYAPPLTQQEALLLNQLGAKM